jgi:hypothetical protein
MESTQKDVILSPPTAPVQIFMQTDRRTGEPLSLVRCPRKQFSQFFSISRVNFIAAKKCPRFQPRLPDIWGKRCRDSLDQY